MQTLHFKNLSMVLAWDADAGSHVYLADADLVIRGNEIVHVGPAYAGPADQVIDGRGRMAMPGLINIHTHPSSEPGNRGLLEELGSEKLGQSSLYEYMPVFRLGIEFAPYANQVAISEMLKSGVTTVVDMSLPRPGWADVVAETGIRGVLGPMFRSASWKTNDGHSVEYSWDEPAARKSFQAALDVVDSAMKHPSGRLSAMLCPSQIDTCSPELLKDAQAEARRLDIPLQIHAAQSVVEFAEMTRRHGRTPIEWLDDLGLLDSRLVIGHGIFLNDHPALFWPQADDFERLRKSGAHVAHCPTVFVRRGIALNFLGRYLRAGINVGIGTDTFPHNMLDELRTACYVARLQAGNFKAASTQEVFDAATVNGAKILGRDDIGRLAPGCKADFSLVDLTHDYMRPCREPLRSLIYSAGDRAVRDVYVDGRQVVRDGQVLTIDVDRALAEVERGQQLNIATVSQRDYAGRDIDAMSPRVYPLAAGGTGV
ncbi:N-ethylammeline chlorohydrolase [Bordetella genomosp. 10]|uniref:N-ethylammeline chlorohydrolase n=1 Tax=Bordetella genomosp. 10 TaxID=1416804 RepID=A0A261SMA0_9BORD|nr:amidohydrolase family protein [Bordetella genomosp. 10]OZI37423.1 N-ethylammeline chlorohydrolase [Bordetella genomosp. 10]